MIILMIKLLLMLPKLNPTPKKKQSYSGKEKTHDQNTSNYQTRNQKGVQQVFARKKHDYALFKDQNPNFKNTNCGW
ncbi:hypothetical protein [Spiroplasma poulsonii]|uniref:hypothetical protein n=1 Tax=Spiroplasma poulsonii TaxID=2138 RepID=UPI001F4CB466|nr:hypothetical protein [Spiroplasma poulsonii]UNF61838.1 hypothetical protein MNU24_07960 [Spiroplasma poulsonii]